MNFINVAKGNKVKITYLTKFKKGDEIIGEIVYIFKAFKVPSKKKIIKYYGKEIIDPKYAGIFGPNKTARLVVKKENTEDYIVLPLGGWNRYFKITNLFKCKFCGGYQEKEI